jgi:hypothetical protein
MPEHPKSKPQVGKQSNGRKSMKRHMTLFAAYGSFALMTASPSIAAVTAQQASALGETLTPLGAEKAGNAAGTIPAWTGGITQMVQGETPNGPLPNLYGNDRKLFTIDDSNVDQYADKLSAGVVQMVKTVPGFHLDVYPSHRDAAEPQWEYDNTKINATKATTTESRYLTGAFGGTPFPIPQTGLEVVWNHLLAWRGYNSEVDSYLYVVPPNHAPILSQFTKDNYLFPYYDPASSRDTYKGYFLLGLSRVFAPANIAGEFFASRQPSETPPLDRLIWEYLVGQRRLRMAPDLAYDGIYPACGNILDSDEIQVFYGQPDHYNFTLEGKQEMYVPYDENALTLESASQALGPLFMRDVRWELHRVWEVKAVVRPGFRNIVATRTMYADEDTWNFLVSDEYDAQGNLWKVNMALPVTAPAIPGVVAISSIIYDLKGSGYCANQVANGPDGKLIFPTDRPASEYDPNTLVSENPQ